MMKVEAGDILEFVGPHTGFQTTWKPWPKIDAMDVYQSIPVGAVVLVLGEGHAKHPLLLSFTDRRKYWIFSIDQTFEGWRKINGGDHATDTQTMA